MFRDSVDSGGKSSHIMSDFRQMRVSFTGSFTIVGSRSAYTGPSGHQRDIKVTVVRRRSLAASAHQSEDCNDTPCVNEDRRSHSNEHDMATSDIRSQKAMVDLSQDETSFKGQLLTPGQRPDLGYRPGTIPVLEIGI
jgi:hypothetical protein